MRGAGAGAERSAGADRAAGAGDDSTRRGIGIDGFWLVTGRGGADSIRWRISVDRFGAG